MFEKNVEKIRKRLATADFDALLLTSPQNRFYTTGFRSSAGVVVITRDAAYFMTDFRYFEDATGRISGMELIMVGYSKKYTDVINSIIEKHDIKRLGFESDSMTYDEYTKYNESLNAQLVSQNGMCEELRLVKEDFEKDRIVKALRIAEKAFSELLGVIKVGMSEADARTELEYLMMKNGGEGASFSTIAVSGTNGSHCHGVPGERKLCPGDFLTLDFGCIYKGYCSDITRTIALDHATDEMKKVYDTVYAAQTESMKYAKAGVIGRDLHNVAAKVIDEAGYGEYFGHGLGHSLGIDVHDGIGASPTQLKPLPKNAVISCEPGIYIPGKFGVRIEDIIMLDDEGCTDLTQAPRELIIV